MEQFMRKYSVMLTTLLGICAAAWLIWKWDSMDMAAKLPVIYIIALALHEIEELSLPGGFVELVTEMTGIEIKNIGVAKFGLLMFTLYATVLPAFLSGLTWPVMSTLLIGCIELAAHLAAARANNGRFYSPGMLTALAVQFPVAVYGFYYLITERLVRGSYWLWAVLFLLVPLFGLQALIVRSNGQKWTEFMKNAAMAMASGKEK